MQQSSVAQTEHDWNSFELDDLKGPYWQQRFYIVLPTIKKEILIDRIKHVDIEFTILFELMEII